LRIPILCGDQSLERRNGACQSQMPCAVLPVDAAAANRVHCPGIQIIQAEFDRLKEKR